MGIETPTTTEIEIKKPEPVMNDCDVLNPVLPMQDKVALAGHIADTLKFVIKSQNLSITISNKEYVLLEGWNTLGIILGCTPYVEEVREISFSEKKHQWGYEATVSIRQGENILSRASAIAERNKRQTDRPSVYSMAQTRATGKAFRLALSWIIKMAGYNPTPAEEMPDFKEIKIMEDKE
ncbi:hypothetical protein [uncultured Methanobrevibacter sp.]|uniref:hypothetical protein n=1 Tax=uncultured Methanobrevibacter sp. TaxID=253161 RepID=UPI00261BD8CE|nr:hypothetical protein [uncultured Methanobrevibacter sp.]